MRFLVTLLITALSYFVAGRIGLLLAIPPGFASAVWPAAGVALALVLMGRPWQGAVLGTGLGSFFVNFSITSSEFSQIEWQAALPALGISVGAMLQVLLSAYMYRRFVSGISVLAISEKLAAFALVVTPIGCLVGASVGALTLFNFGVIQMNQVPFTWGTWWIGDMLGVLLMTPLVLSMLSPVSGLDAKRKMQVVVPILSIFVVIWLFFQASLSSSQNKMRVAFERASQSVYTNIDERFQLLQSKLLAFNAFYNSVPQVDQQAFMRFSEMTLLQGGNFTGIGWTEIIPHDQRARVERHFQQNGYPEFRFKQFSPSGLVTSNPKAEYFPVLYIYPEATNKAAIGLDLGSNENRRLTLLAAKESKKPISTGPLTLAQEQADQKSIIVYVPIFRRYDVKEESQFLGYVSGVIRVIDVMEDILSSAHSLGVEVNIIDITDDQEKPLLITTKNDNDQLPVQNKRLAFAGRTYQVELSSYKGFVPDVKDWNSWLVLTGGFFMAALLQAFLLNIVNSISIVRRQVMQKTSELREAVIAAQDASKAKSQFLANMSHELRTPLNAIIGFVNLCLKGSLNPKQADYLNNVSLASNTLLGLINQTLDYSKIEAGKLELHQETFSLLDFLKKMQALFYLTAKDKGLQFEIDVVGHLPRHVKGDSLRLEQIIINLLGNAVKFTETGYVRMAVHQKDSDDHQCNLVFQIEDSGIGIADDNIQELFQTFSQADASTVRRFGGTGLGLSISRALAELMNGSLDAQSVLGKGSTFKLEVELRATDDSESFVLADIHQSHASSSLSNENNEEQSANKLSGLHVLLVEDVPMNQWLAQELLESNGATVTTANNGQEALEALEGQHGFDIVLMDIQMPIMDGYEATKTLRAQVAFDDLPILAMTANAMDDDVEKCLLAGMQDHIAKPIDEQALIQAMLKHCQRT